MTSTVTSQAQVPERTPETHVIPPSEKLMFGKRDAAALLSIGVRTLDRLIASGRIRHKRVGKKILISRTEIEKFAKGGDVETKNV